MTPWRHWLKRTLMTVSACGVVSPLTAASPDSVPPDLPNVFISPSGQPFRARAGEPYPVVAWFSQVDKNGDGKIDKAEFVADAEAFFKILDRNSDGFLSPNEIAFYEQRIAPEILGGRVSTESYFGPIPHNPLLWLTQVNRPAPIDPGGGGDSEPEPPKIKGLDESGQGASPFGLFDEPEPVMAADLSFRGMVTRDGFKRLASIHFDNLDPDEHGQLTLAKLPKTPVQAAIDRAAAKRRKR